MALKRVCRWLAFGAGAGIGAGLLVRAGGWRDAVRLTEPFYYATPWPVMAGLGAMLAASAFLLGWRKRALAGMALAAGFAFIWMQHSLMRTPAAPGSAWAVAGRVRVAYWNANRPGPHPEKRIAFLQSLQADVLVVGESGVREDVDLPAAWQEGFPGKVLTIGPAGMLLVSPQAPEHFESGSLNGLGDYALARCAVGGRPLNLLMVDFHAPPTRSRAGAFRKLEELLRETADLPGRLVVGDFNTPRESPFFRPLRAQFRDAFESAGSGLAETWPVPLPVLSLDRIWVGPGWRALRCELGWSLQSDHRAVVADLVPEQVR